MGQKIAINCSQNVNVDNALVVSVLIHLAQCRNLAGAKGLEIDLKFTRITGTASG